MLRALLLGGLLVAVAGPALAQPRLTIHADRPQHRFDGAAVSFGLYLGHHHSMPAAAQDQAVRWIADDLDLAFLQDYPDGEIEPSAANAAYYDRRADYVRAARAYRPGLQFSLVTNKFPSRLRREITVGGRTYLVLDAQRPGIYREVAAWYFALFQAFAERGVSVEILNAVNEPDLDVCSTDRLQCRPYHYGYGADTKRGVAEIFAQAVPAFLAMFDDPAVNTLGMRRPRVMGPSTIAPGGVRDGGQEDGAIQYVRYFKQNRPEAWAAIDIVATHQYINGVRGDLFQVLQAEAEGKPVWQSETHGSKTFGPTTLRAGHRTALSTAQLIGASVNFGTSVWAYFETNYPNPADPADPDAFNPGGLLSTPFNTASPERTKQYTVFRQLTSTQPDSSAVLDYTATTGRRADALALRRSGEDVVYVHYTNTTGTATTLTLEVSDTGGLRRLRSYAVRTTDATRDDAVVTPETALPAGASAVDVVAGPYSVSTVVLTLAPLATQGDTGPEGGLALAPPRPNPSAGAVAVHFHLAAPSDVTLSVYDALGRRVAVLAEGPHAAGTHRVEAAGLGLAPGLYRVVLDGGARRQSQPLTVVR